MLALSNIGMNDFSYASLLQRSSARSKKSFQHQAFQSAQINSSDIDGQVEWKPEHFPHKMYDLLEDVERKGLDDIVSWLPDGKSFKIHSQIGFEQSIMPLYFSGMSSYKSFRRQLNLYGIYQHRHRPNQDANAYSHELLIRGQRHLCDKIARKKTTPPNKNKSGSSSSKNNNFAKKVNTNKTRDRSSLVATIDQRNMKTSSEPRIGKQEVVPSSSMSTNALMQLSFNDMMRRNMLTKSMYDDVSTRPNPVDLSNIGNKYENTLNRAVDNNSVFQSFMGQYWDDLPTNMSSSQVVDEIIATFQQRQL